MSANSEVRPFGIKDKLGYLFGDFGNDFTFILSSSFLMKFYTDVMNVSPAVVGGIMAFARFVDAFTDVTMGRICDRSKTTKNGKFRPWILKMSGPVAIASFLMYQSSLANLSYTAKVVYLFITYILWGSVFYTSINIPYGSMASAISGNPDDRQSLSIYRSMGGMLAGAFVTAVIPLVVYDKVNGKDVMNGGRFTLVAGACSVLAIVCYLLCYNLVRERTTINSAPLNHGDNNVFRMLGNAVKNRALISIIAASVVMLLAQLTLQQMTNYIYPNYYGNASMQSVSTLAMSGGMIVAAGIAKPVARKFGKAEISAFSNLLAGLGSFLIYFIRPQNVIVYIVIQTACWLGLGVFSMVSWALITDVIDYSEIKNGVREDGSVYALYSFARKLGQAAASGVTGALLTAIGYSESTAFNKNVLEGIFDISTLVPGVGFILLALILWFWYPLHKKQVNENVVYLEKKHKK
jgi:GPH family glycoside/pentoside/hexuronide:cation symporter